MSYSEEKEQEAFKKLISCAGDRACFLEKTYNRYSSGTTKITYSATILPSICSVGNETAEAAVTAVIEMDKMKKEEEKNATTTA